jgi:Ca2+-binding EF-hand superfamily protein
MSPRIVVLGLALLIGATESAIAQGRGSRTRFAGMDGNGDGRITRAEWRGSDRSFRVHDWNRDGVLSGQELRVDARRPGRGAAVDRDFDSPYREYPFDDWTARGFQALDHNRDGRVSAEEWHFDRESFRRADHNRDNSLSRAEFLSENADVDDDREDGFEDLDADRDGRVSAAEWHGTDAAFAALDDDGDRSLTRREMLGDTPPLELFDSVDVNRDRLISRNEWHWNRRSFDQRDTNRDGRLSRQEFEGKAAAQNRSAAYQAGYQRGLTEGAAAGREDRERNQPWDIEGQREMQSANSGYTAAMGPLQDYQTGYREGFREAYPGAFKGQAR